MLEQLAQSHRGSWESSDLSNAFRNYWNVCVSVCACVCALWRDLDLNTHIFTLLQSRCIMKLPVCKETRGKNMQNLKKEKQTNWKSKQSL